MFSLHHRYVRVSNGQDQQRQCALEISLLKAFVLAFLMLCLSGLSFLTGKYSTQDQDWHDIQREFSWRHEHDIR